jgi:hypothetical protein
MLSLPAGRIEPVAVLRLRAALRATLDAKREVERVNLQLRTEIGRLRRKLLRRKDKPAE